MLFETTKISAIEEEDQGHFNCAGFALDQEEWIELDNWHTVGDALDESECDSYDEYREMVRMETEEIAENCANEIEDRFIGVRRISSLMDLDDNEYAFAFRVGEDDFHFMRQYRDGWRHKRGGWPIEDIEDCNVFCSEWEHGDTPYNSTMYMFAKAIDR